MEISDSMIEKYRHWNVEHDEWWQCTYEDFKQQMGEQGIYVSDMYFSGFWSQGDGACFEGFIEDMKQYLEKNFKPDDYPMIRKLLDGGGSVKFSVKHSGHYYHENCTQFYIEADRLEHVLDAPSDFHVAVLENYDQLLDGEIVDFEKESVEIFKNFMRKFYRDLEQEYDHLTSDEAVKEAIVANELTNDEGEE